VPASAFPSIQFNFSVVCKNDGRTWLAARLKTGSGVPCVDLWTTGNGLDAQAGKAGAISVTFLGGPECPLPVEVTELEVTSASSTVGGWGVSVPLYFDTCFVNQSFPVDYKLVP
jgi:hypothetical protein